MYTIEEFDRYKTKVLKYIMYKKRTEQEIRIKFESNIDEEMLEDIIEELKENNYISDENYIKRAVDEFIALKNLSIKEIKYKLISKGIKASLADKYISNNIDRLEEYEMKSAENIVTKKSINMEENEIKQYLLKKGYKQENVNIVLEGLED